MAAPERFVNFDTGSPQALRDAVNSVFGPSGANHAAGLVPDPGSSAGTSRFLREDATFAAPPAATFTQSGTGAVTRTVDAKLKEGAISILDFGADPTGVADCSTALNNAYTEAQTLKKPLYIPTGTYRLSSQITFSLATNPTLGTTVFGDGAQLSLLNFDSGVASPNLQIVGNANQSTFYSRFVGFGVAGAINGTVLQLGRTDLTDPMNQSNFEQITVNNKNSGASAIGVQVNSLVGCVFNNLVANGNGTGTGLAALELVQAQFCTFLAGSFGNSAKCVYITSGFTFASTFFSVDTEVATTAWVCDSSHAANNTWVGGQVTNVTNGFDFSAGSANVILNPNISVSGSELVGTTGITLKRPGDNQISTPGVPGNGTPLTNTTGMVAVVTVYGGSFTQIIWNGATISSTTTTTVILNPGDTITLTYTVAPSWLWLPLYV